MTQPLVPHICVGKRIDAARSLTLLGDGETAVTTIPPDTTRPLPVPVA